MTKKYAETLCGQLEGGRMKVVSHAGQAHLPPSCPNSPLAETGDSPDAIWQIAHALVQLQHSQQPLLGQCTCVSQPFFSTA